MKRVVFLIAVLLALSTCSVANASGRGAAYRFAKATAAYEFDKGTGVADVRWCERYEAEPGEVEVLCGVGWSGLMGGLQTDCAAYILAVRDPDHPRRFIADFTDEEGMLCVQPQPY